MFWDPTYAGNIAVIDDWHTAMGMVLLRNGIHDLNTTKAADITLMHDQMIDMLDKTKPPVTITMYNDLPAGQYGACQMWSGDVVNAQYYLPKGQSPVTARLVAEQLRQADAPVTAAGIAEQLGISRATAQRYLAALSEEGRATMTLRYGSTGRPEHRYTWIGRL